jgi:hypothetical protein
VIDLRRDLGLTASIKPVTLCERVTADCTDELALRSEMTIYPDFSPEAVATPTHHPAVQAAATATGCPRITAPTDGRNTLGNHGRNAAEKG